eukprot:11384588-Karenia_brevis.AAC.1
MWDYVGLRILSILAFASVAATLALMQPSFGPMQGRGMRNRNQRDPPSWDPAGEATYPFRNWSQDLLAWT